MTSRILVALIVLAACLFSCSDSSEEATLNLVGQWVMSTSENYNCNLAEDNKVYECGTYGFCSTLTLNSDKTFTSIRTWDDANLGSGTYKVSSTRLYLYYTGSSSIDYAVTLNGSTMLLDHSSSTASCSSKDTFVKQ